MRWMRQEAPGLACSGRQRGLEGETDEARPGTGEDGRQSLPLVVKYSLTVVAWSICRERRG